MRFAFSYRNEVNTVVHRDCMQSPLFHAQFAVISVRKFYEVYEGKPNAVNIFIYSNKLKFPHGWKFQIPENALVARHKNALSMNPGNGENGHGCRRWRWDA